MKDSCANEKRADLQFEFRGRPVRPLNRQPLSPSSLIAIQVLDGIGAAIFGVVSVLVIADLTQGTGRFNLTSGAVMTAVGIGAALSQSIAGAPVRSEAIVMLERPLCASLYPDRRRPRPSCAAPREC